MSASTETADDNIFITPSPGLHLVGTYMGTVEIKSKNGDVHHFVKILTADALVQAYLPAEKLLEYAQKQQGEVVIVPVSVNARKNKLTGQVMDEVQYGVQRGPSK